MGKLFINGEFFICKDNNVSSCHHASRLLRRKKMMTNNNNCQTGRDSKRVDNMAEKGPALYYGVRLIIATCEVLGIMLWVL
jgi:hypothetical protein